MQFSFSPLLRKSKAPGHKTVDKDVYESLSSGCESEEEDDLSIKPVRLENLLSSEYCECFVEFFIAYQMSEKTRKSKFKQQQWVRLLLKINIWANVTILQ